MSREQPGKSAVEWKNPRVEQLKNEIALEEGKLRQNEEYLEGLVTELEEEKGKDRVGVAQEKYDHLIEKFAKEQKEFKKSLFPMVTTLGTIGAAGTAWFQGIQGFGKGATVGVAVAGILWAIGRLGIAFERRLARKEFEDEFDKANKASEEGDKDEVDENEIHEAN